MLREQRSAYQDGTTIWNSLAINPSLLGAGNIPQNGPLVVCCNHYNGESVWVGLPAALLAHILGTLRPEAAVRGVGVASYENLRILFCAYTLCRNGTCLRSLL